MSRRRKYAPIERIRRVLLLLLVVLAAGVAVIYMRRERPQETPRPESAPRLGQADGEEVILAGEGFEYEHTEENRTVFRLRAAEIASSREGRFRLRDVQVDVEREAGDPYVVRSDEAVYEIEDSEALLSGNVRVRSTRGLELRTDGLELVRGGAALQSSGEVRFELGDTYQGRADRLVYNLGRERLRLEGKVRIGSRRGLGDVALAGSLRADEVVFEREERLLRAQGDVELRRGESLLATRRLSLTLGEDEQTLEFVRATSEVTGRLRPETGGDFATTVEFRGDQLSVALADGEPRRAELESEKGKPVRLDSVDDAGLRRVLTAPYLMADFAPGGELSIVRAYDGVTVEETLTFAPDDPLRAVCAEWLLAGYDDEGALTELVLQNAVDYREQGLQAEGNRIDARSTGLDLTGEPAALRSDRGEIESPKIAWRRADGRVQAGEGVTALFPGDGRFSLIGDGGKLPIRLLSREASWSDEPAEFRFSGKVRAWQGENYLLADRLVGERDSNRLVASGQVKTVVRPRPEAETGGEPARERPPVEITADSFTYDRGERQLSYAGSVKAHETGRTMSCSEMDAWMDSGDRFDRLVCSGSVVIEDPAEGRTLRGDQALYEPGQARVELTGAPVVMSGRDGAELTGPVVVYDLDTGAAEVRASPPMEEPD